MLRFTTLLISLRLSVTYSFLKDNSLFPLEMPVNLNWPFYPVFSAGSFITFRPVKCLLEIIQYIPQSWWYMCIIFHMFLTNSVYWLKSVSKLYCGVYFVVCSQWESFSVSSCNPTPTLVTVPASRLMLLDCGTGGSSTPLCSRSIASSALSAWSICSRRCCWSVMPPTASR